MADETGNENSLPEDRIIPINIDEEMRSAYIDYSMSVIVSRALPDVRDGLKPVHRRVLFGMLDLGLSNNKPYKKSARIVGEVMVSITRMVTHQCMTPWCVWRRSGAYDIHWSKVRETTVLLMVITLRQCVIQRQGLKR